MPYTIRQRGDEWCVTKDADGQVMGCHASRDRAIKQLAALNISEATTAAADPSRNGEAIRLELAQPDSEVEKAMVASLEKVSEQMAALAKRIARDEELMERILSVVDGISIREERDYHELRAALTASLERPDPEPPVVNVTVPEPVVTVNVPEAVVNVPQQPAPQVNVTIPPARKEIKFTRDPMTNQISGADVVESDDG